MLLNIAQEDLEVHQSVVIRFEPYSDAFDGLRANALHRCAHEFKQIDYYVRTVGFGRRREHNCHDDEIHWSLSIIVGFPSLYHRIFSFPHCNNQERTCVYALLQKFYWSVNLSRRIGKSYGAGQQQPRQTSASVFGRPITIYPSFEGLAYLVVIVRPTRITPIHHYYY